MQLNELKVKYFQLMNDNDIITQELKQLFIAKEKIHIEIHNYEKEIKEKNSIKKENGILKSELIKLKSQKQKRDLKIEVLSVQIKN